MSRFDHIEVHVADVPRYCRFLVDIFEGGRWEVISKSGTSMFFSPEGVNIEIKQRKVATGPEMSGFCNPCLRRANPLELVTRLGLNIEHELESMSCRVIFFKDHEGVTWHIKDLPEEQS